MDMMMPMERMLYDYLSLLHSNSSKNLKALELNVPIITELEFNEMIEREV
jgi:hypothetical protein